MKIPARKMPLWKILALSLFVLGGIGLLEAIFPPGPTTTSVVTAISLTFLGTCGMVLTARTRFLWGREISFNAWLLLLFASGLRMIDWVSPISTGWVLLLLALYALAWFLPYIDSRISAVILREQMTPRSKAGKIYLQVVRRVIVPLSGAGVLMGLYSSHRGRGDYVMLSVGILTILGMLIGAQAISHRIWEQKQATKTSTEETEV